jgi:iron-regulated transporter 1
MARSAALICAANYFLQLFAWFIVQYPPYWSIVGQAAFSLVAMLLEIFLFRCVRRCHSSLSVSKSIVPDFAGESESDFCPLTKTYAVATRTSEVSSWKYYLHRPIFMYSLSMALLYISVLSFDRQMGSFLSLEMHMSTQFIATYRALAAFAGVGATWIAPHLISWFGQPELWSIWGQRLNLFPVAMFCIL